MSNKPTLTGGDASISPDETELLAAFRSMSNGYHRNAIIVMQSIARSFPRHRPALTLVQGAGQRKGGRNAKS